MVDIVDDVVDRAARNAGDHREELIEVHQRRQDGHGDVQRVEYGHFEQIGIERSDHLFGEVVGPSRER